MKVVPEETIDIKEINTFWHKSKQNHKTMGETSTIKKFKLLMWKNWLLQKRRKKQTFLEIILSIVFCVLLVIIRDLAPSEDYSSPTFYKPFAISSLPDTLGSDSGGLVDVIVGLFSDNNSDKSRFRRQINNFSIYSFTDENLHLLEEDILKSPRIICYLKENPSGISIVEDFVKMIRKNILKRRNFYERRLKHKPRRVKRFLQYIFGESYWPVAYAPNNSVVNGIMTALEDQLLIDTQGYGFATEEEMVKHLTVFNLDSEDLDGNRFEGLNDILGGIVFINDFPNETLPKNIKYKIRLKASPRTGKKALALAPPPRWNTEITYPMFQVPGPRNREENEGGNPGYYSEGFLALQFALDKAIANYLNGSDIDLFADVQLQRMPYPPYIDDKYLVALQGWLPLILLLSYLYPAVNIVRSVVYEKEKKLKESMKMMGLSNLLHWTAWFTKSLIFLLITTLLVTLLLCTRWNGKGSMAVLDRSDPTLVFFILFIYSCCTISFCFLLSTLFCKANSGATLAGIIWLFSYIPNIYLRPRFLSISTDMKILLCLYFNIGMSLSCFLTSMFEGVGSGLQWNLIFSGISPDSPFSIFHVLTMMVLDTFIYSTLTWYIEAVHPGEFGVPLPWNFPFKKSYWFGIDSTRMANVVHGTEAENRYFEKEPVHLCTGICIKGLTKIFNKGKTAVNNMFLNMYSGQITVLLGHNGAGKTTTMSMLTGLFPPTRGTAEVNGFDIVTEMDEVRNSIGICPQHDILFDDLTVAEHIIFFSELKGLTGDAIKTEIENLLTAIKLLDKRDSPSKALSGGMKRKLSVSIALCGGSKVVILDEPTSGMDPGARRAIWDLLQREKNERTMLLTTHFMEEADLLGDRIAIMANGVVQCCGSSIFLKKLYGAGYHLTLVKKKDCKVQNVTEAIVSHIPEAEVELNVAAELTYILPNDQISKFKSLFNELERRKDQLCISSYGASQTTMEEVFLKVGSEIVSDDVESPIITSAQPTPSNEIQATERGLLLNENYETIKLDIIDKKEEISPVQTNISSPVPMEEIKLKRKKGFTLFLQQFWAMLVKKMLYSFRNFLITVIQLLIPIFFLIIVMVVLRSMPGVNDSPPALKASLEPFLSTTTAVNNVSTGSFLEFYKDQFSRNHEIITADSSKNLSEFLLKKAEANLPSFNLHWIAALEASTRLIFTNIIAYFNNQPYHVPPIVLNLVDQALVRMSTNISDLQVTTFNHPLPRNDTEKLTQESRQNVGFNIGFNLAFGMSFLSASFVLFIIRERSSNCKHLQFVSGVNCFVYWAATAVWDTMCFLITIILVIVCLVVYNEDGLNSCAQLGRVFLVLLLYCWAILPFMYIFSFFFSVPSTGFIRMTMVHLFTGMATLITVTILRIPDLELKPIADILDWIFLLFPPYAMASAIGELYTNARFTKICQNPAMKFVCITGIFENPCCRSTDMCGNFGCVLWTEDILGWEKLGIGRMLVFLSLEGALFYFIIAMIEMKIFRTAQYFLKTIFRKVFNAVSRESRRSNCHSMDPEDEDVKIERERIQNASLENIFQTDKLIIRDLTKIYDGTLVAVDHLNVGVPLGECFGLLGINGAGKTSLFKMLTGDLPVSSGDGYINGYSIKTNIKSVQQEMGYCPQFDAVLDQMTGRETLRMFGRLRGVPSRQLEVDINGVAQQLLLTPHMDKLVGKYSGGNKRKLSTGIALMGDPPLLLLDEPTSGMDPLARRHLWRVLNSVRDAGRGIVLTSHSMEECEALCTRLAIMTNGKFRCIGSPQELKSKFSEGYSLIVRVEVDQNRELNDVLLSVMPAEMALVDEFVLKTFNKSYLREKQWGRLEYFIPVTAASWADIFGILEENRTALNIIDYSVTQTTLERVFLNFTRGQRPERT